MNLNEFITKWNYKYCEVTDPTNPNQCFDLVVAWTDNLGIPRVFPFMFAYQIYTSFGTLQAKYFDRIVNTPDAVPNPGDIVVWGNNYNFAGGHTGIYVAGDVWSLNAFEQNDPMRSVCHIRNYNYNYVLGWLRPKIITQQPLNDTQKVNAITKEMQSNNSNDTKISNIKKILGL